MFGLFKRKTEDQRIDDSVQQILKRQKKREQFEMENKPTKKQRYKWRGMHVPSNASPEWKERAKQSHESILKKYGRAK